MPTELKRLTFAVPLDMEIHLDAAKKEQFYNRSQSDMIRALVKAGLDSVQRHLPGQV